jgi:hypothetical protein
MKLRQPRLSQKVDTKSLTTCMKVVE